MTLSDASISCSENFLELAYAIAKNPIQGRYYQ